MSKGLVCIFGADGALGRQIVEKLAGDGWRIRAAVRRPHTAGELLVPGRVGQIQIVQANVRYRLSVSKAVTGCDAVINLAGILREKGRQTFNGVHNIGARNVAEAACNADIDNMVHISALGANAASGSKYLRSKADGEQAVRDTVPKADILRPALMFGPQDGFITGLARLAMLSPVMPVPGGGHTKMQPVYVTDIAEAVRRIVAEGSSGQIRELGGPQVLSLRQITEFVLEATDRKRLLVPIPWFVMNMMGMVGSALGHIPLVKPWITSDQVKLLREDMVVPDDAPGLKALGIIPETLAAIMSEALIPYRKYGQFHEMIVEDV
ncbi:MAG TPA: complex I NDUFA9 subunit family protein [Anaerolineae bacterium]|nr:complex I NDUFA9 subunit family protein [Anaerolineae bacterium]